MISLVAACQGRADRASGFGGLSRARGLDHLSSQARVPLTEDIKKKTGRGGSCVAPWRRNPSGLSLNSISTSFEWDTCGKIAFSSLALSWAS